MNRRPPVPIVRYFAFVMPVYDEGQDQCLPAEEWTFCTGFMVFGWDTKSQAWTKLAVYEESEFRAAKRHAREHHESICESLGIDPYVPRRSAVTAPQVDTVSSAVYQVTDVTGNVTNR